MIKICKCTCQSEYQDTKYGKDMRVCKYAIKKGVYICSICRKEHK